MGRTSYGLERGDRGFLQQEIYLPLWSPETQQLTGVLRLASFLNQMDLDHFRAQTGLEASLFFGEQRVVTTLGRPNFGAVLDVGADEAIFRRVVQEGKEVIGWRNLPIGRVRSYYVPLVGSSGDRVGMCSIALPESAIVGELQNALIPILPVVAVITLVGSALAYLLARRVRDPVLVLSRAARRFSLETCPLQSLRWGY
ncbi:MAG: cache domain-containing protein [Chloroflexi bacterium]|nr:cache domain-containing protein [Chloroflexota bacterium]